MSEESFIQHDVENKQLKKEKKIKWKWKWEWQCQWKWEWEWQWKWTWKWEWEWEWKWKIKKKVVKDYNIWKLIEKPKEIKIPNWIDKNKF